MTVAVLVASGRTGLALVRTVLSLGIQTIAVVRSHSRLAEGIEDEVTIVAGEGISEKKVQATLKHKPEVIVCTVGSASPFGTQSICTDVTRAFIKAIRDLPKIRFVAMSSIGAHDSASQVGALTQIAVAIVVRQVMKDHSAQEDVATRNLPSSRWLILRPTVINDKPVEKSYQTRQKGRYDNDRISRNAVAKFITHQIIGHGDLLQGKKVAISS